MVPVGYEAVSLIFHLVLNVVDPNLSLPACVYCDAEGKSRRG